MSTHADTVKLKQTFTSNIDLGFGKIYESITFERCTFIDCHLSSTKNVTKRTTIRSIRVENCTASNCTVGTAILEDVTVNGLRTRGLLQTWGAVFNRVVLRGKIDRIMISPLVATGVASISEQQSFDAANRRYYENVDWALDISMGQFRECDIRGIPSRLIKLDPTDQFVLARPSAQKLPWRDLLKGTEWFFAIDLMLERGDEDVVLVAPRRAKNYQSLLDLAQAMRGRSLL